MKKWEYMMKTHYMAKIRSKGSSVLALPSYDASDIWERKFANGKTTWDAIKEMGKEGWNDVLCSLG